VSLFRIPPQGKPSDYKTYQILQPRSTHTRPATCQEVDCPNYAYGWRTIVDVSTDLGARQANYIRLKSGRAFTHVQADTLVTFIFASGQKCFAEHRVSLECDPIYRIKGGDWRGNPRKVPTIPLPGNSWVADFGEHQEKLKERLG
jgi:hypothetical protein